MGTESWPSAKNKGEVKTEIPYSELNGSHNEKMGLNVGEAQLFEVMQTVKDTQKGAVVDLFKWNDSPEKVAEAFKSMGLQVEVSTDDDAKVNENSVARLFVSKDQDVIGQLKNLKRGPEYPGQYKSITGFY